MSGVQASQHVRCRCPACLHPRTIDLDYSPGDSVTCEKCGKTSAFHQWNGFWQAAELQKERLRQIEWNEIALQWRRFLFGWGLAALAPVFLGMWVFASYAGALGARGGVALILFTLAIFAGGYCFSVIARKRVFPTAEFTRVAFFFSGTVTVFAIVLVAVYATPASLKAGVIFFLVLIAIFGAVFYYRRITTQELRDAIDRAQTKFDEVFDDMDGGRSLVGRIREPKGRNPESETTDHDFPDFD